MRINFTHFPYIEKLLFLIYIKDNNKVFERIMCVKL